MSRYALISDIHGNLPAFLAVLEDAKKHAADQLLLLGDYIEDFPWPNEVVQTIRGLENAIVIRGNKEEYLLNMQGEDQTQWVYEQMMPMCWNYRALTADHLEYLVALPASVELTDENGASIFLSHASSVFKCMLGNQEVISEIAKKPTGVYAFGHIHIQWHMEIEGRLFINPGSCGMPLDFDGGAPYTILEQTGPHWQVIQRRVPYDTEAAIEALRFSSLFAQAEIWSRIMIRQLRTGTDIINPFIHHAQGLARKRGCPVHPISNDLWWEAAATFELWDIFEG
ncbi:MAG: metallophosphatase family protein [Clostridia bacterium]|nr:metallophosphatase family protein [Clostridia bacterium]